MNEEKLLKHIATYSVILMMSVVTFSVGIKYPKESISYASEVTKAPTPTIMLNSVPVIQENIMNNSGKEMIGGEGLYNLPQLISKDLREQLGDNFIAISKPEKLSDNYNFTLEDLSVDRKIIIRIKGIENNSISAMDIHRVYQDHYHYGSIATTIPTPVVSQEDEITISEEEILSQGAIPSTAILSTHEPEPKPEDAVTNFNMEYITTADGTVELVLSINLIKTYAYILDEDENYFFISFVNPHEIYDKIIVLDAGHGGNDSGTSSNQRDYLEKTINLDMTLKLYDYLKENTDIKVYMTRTTDRKLTLSQRVNLANDVEADLFLSIHCNANLSKGINGTEVLYNDKQNTWDSFNSKQFAMICQEELVRAIGLKDRGIVARSQDVHIIGESKVPVALVEVAFMSNTNDMNFLKKDENRTNAAKGLYQAVLKALEKQKEINGM